MKKMKFLMGVLACFLITLSFGTSVVSAYSTNPRSYFDNLTLTGPNGTTQKNYPILVTMDDPNGDGDTSDVSSCITFNASFCLDDVATLNLTPKEGVIVTFPDGSTITGVIENGSLKTFTKDITVDTATKEITFTATIGDVTEDFSITLTGNEVCSADKTYCTIDPTQDDLIEACIDAGKDEDTCVGIYCKSYCTSDSTKDADIKSCIYGGTDETTCIEKYCPTTTTKTYCEEDPTKDDEVQNCIDEGGSEADCIQKICVQENPKTGIASPVIGIVALGALVIGNVLIFRKREN